MVCPISHTIPYTMLALLSLCLHESSSPCNFPIPRVWKTNVYHSQCVPNVLQGCSARSLPRHQGGLWTWDFLAMLGQVRLGCCKGRINVSCSMKWVLSFGSRMGCKNLHLECPQSLTSNVLDIILHWC